MHKILHLILNVVVIEIVEVQRRQYNSLEVGQSLSGNLHELIKEGSQTEIGLFLGT